MSAQADPWYAIVEPPVDDEPPLEERVQLADPEAHDDAPVGASWKPVDIAAVVAGIESGAVDSPMHTVGRIEGGGYLLTPGTVNGIAGPSGSGKSLTAKAIVLQELGAGNNVVYIDLEDRAEAVVAMLLNMGADGGDIVAHLAYVSPNEGYGAAAQANIVALVTAQEPTLVIIDSTGEAMALSGAKPNDDDDTARWFRTFPTAIARMGPAVALLDHVTKIGDDGLWPIGSQRKRAAISGAQYMLKTVRPFSKGHDGHAVLVCAKDRHGTYRQGQRVAELHVRSTGDGLGVTLVAPQEGTSGTFRPTAIMEKVSTVIEDATTPLSVRSIQTLVGGKKDYITTALEVLIAEGYINRVSGARGSLQHHHLKSYTQAKDPKSDAYWSPGDSQPTEVPPDGRDRPLSLKKGDRGDSHTPSPGDSRGTVGDGANPACPVCHLPMTAKALALGATHAGCEVTP